MTDSRRHDFYQEGLTGFRALAAGWVMLFHLNAFAGPRAITLELFSVSIDIHPLLSCGWVGVDLFFVLSGFLLATHLLQSLARPSTAGVFREYLAARIRRVFPAYWAQLLVLFAVATLLAGSIPDWWRYLPLHLPMLHFVSEEASFAINPVYWTLPIEFAFYLCLPLVARHLARAERLGGRAQWITLAMTYLASLALVWTYRYLAFQAYDGSPVNTIAWATSQLPGSFDQFMAGVTAATALRWWKPQGGPRGRATRAISTVLAVAGLGGVIAMIYFIDSIYLDYWKDHPAIYVWHSITSACVALAVLGVALGGPLTRALFESRVVVWLGTVSYSLYLWHYPILRWTKPSLDAAGMELGGYLALVVPLVLAASAASYYAVERPFLRRARRRIVEESVKLNEGIS